MKLAQLLALNQDVAAKIEKGSIVTAPGVPKNYPLSFAPAGLLSSLHPPPTVETVGYFRSSLAGLWNPCSSVKPVSSVVQQEIDRRRPI